MNKVTYLRGREVLIPLYIPEILDIKKIDILCV